MSGESAVVACDRPMPTPSRSLDWTRPVARWIGTWRHWREQRRLLREFESLSLATRKDIGWPGADLVAHDTSVR